MLIELLRICRSGKLFLAHRMGMYGGDHAWILIGDSRRISMAQRIVIHKKQYRTLNFVGISGPISFHKSDRIGITAFHQRQGDKQQLIAIYTPDAPWLNFNCSNCSKAEWQG
ncbi:gamma-aminobutyric acid type B receptor subunit 2 [Caerostris extrusa]|uniref:Gamma-aminobutyric acid type B receptor subunit 2 n=1 Tax=Caerostris extrusa TaxID=172846 RepID=A0AAV4U3J6_CAEEX|nr:gamma-aminobutyric acid type B receptor subunit 2 [Caerostris extrusa]